MQTRQFRIMKEIHSPKTSPGNVERSRECEEALDIAFKELLERATAAGWQEAEIALVLADIADTHVMDVAKRRKQAETYN
jgi:phosphoribosyl-dephospho-CoA transferase